MKLQLVKLGSYFTILLTSGLLLANHARSEILSSWNFDANTNQLKFTLESPSIPNYFLLQNPPRIVIDLPDTELGRVETQASYEGVVTEIRVSQFQEDVTRLVIELSPEVSLSQQQIVLQKLPSNNQKYDWVLRPVLGNSTALNSASTDDVLPSGTDTSSSPTPKVTVPPLEPRSESDRQQRVGGEGEIDEVRISSPVIQFGQPFPTDNSTQPTSSPSAKGNVVLDSGAKVTLRYTGEKSFNVQAGKSRQEVLVVAEDLYGSDRADLGLERRRLIAAAGTPVVGRFETNGEGTFFVTQAITIEGKNFPFPARSAVVSANSQVGDNNGETKSFTIEPGLVVEVELMENWGY